MLAMLICLSEERPVRTCRSQEKEPVLRESVRRLPSTSLNSLTVWSANGSSGKTSRDACRAVPVKGADFATLLSMFTGRDIEPPKGGWGTGGGNLPLVQETIAFEPGIAKREGGDSRFTENFCGTLRGNAGDNQHAVAIAENIIGRKVENGGNGVGAQDELAYTQNATGVMGVCTSTVRRLLPIETERLMGFPDNWTRIPWKGKSADACPDSPRYKACGNSMCVNVMRWIGEQIQKVEERN